MNAAGLLNIRDLIQREARLPFMKQVDLYSVEDGILIGVTGAIGCGFKIAGKDILLESPEEIDNYESRARKFVNSLPQGVTLHFIVQVERGDEAVLREYSEAAGCGDALAKKLIQSRLESCRRNPFVRKEVFLYVVLHPFGKKPRSSFVPDVSIAFGKKTRKLAGLDFSKAKEALLRVGEDVKTGFEGLGFGIKPLGDDEILHYLYETLNPSYSEENLFDGARFLKGQTQSLNPESLRSKLLLTPPIVEDRFFYLGRFFHKSVNLREFPEETDLKVMNDFERELGPEYLLSVSVEVPDQDTEKKNLRKQGNFAKAEEFYSRSKSHDALERVGETDELLTEIAGTSDKLFYVSLAVLIKGKCRADVDSRAQEVLRAFPRLGDARGIEDHMNHDRLFLSTLPLQGSDNPLAFLVKSEGLVHLLPLQASWKGTEKIGLLLRTTCGEPLRFDLFDSKLPAKHAVMLGSTGSGKSFLTNHLLLHFLIESREHEVIVIDVGGSYRKLSQVFGGSYLEVECSGAYAFNPFPVKKMLFPVGKDADATFLQFLKELLQKMIAPFKAWTSNEKMILERAIGQIYGPMEENDAPLLGDIEKCLRDYPFGDAEDKRLAYLFAKELVLYTEGEYGKILNRRGSFNFDAQFTVFDLRKISHYPELQEILLLIIPFALRRKFENLSIKKLLVLDECWRLLKEAQGTELVEVFYRTARKMNAGVLSISQNPEDFLDTKIASVIINNSPVKYILRLKKGYEKLQHYGLNANEILAVQGLEVKPGFYSEAFIKFDEHRVIVKLEPGPLEYWIATTDAIDLVEEAKLRRTESGLTDFEIFQRLAQCFPNGVRKTWGN